MTQPARATPAPSRVLPATIAKAGLGTVALACCLAIATPFIGAHEDGAKTRLCTFRDPVGIVTGPGGADRAAVQARPVLHAHAGRRHDPVREKQEAGKVYLRNPMLGSNPYQFAATTSLRHNIGVGSYRSSTAAARFSAFQWAPACEAFLLFDKATYREGAAQKARLHEGAGRLKMCPAGPRQPPACRTRAVPDGATKISEFKR